MFKNPLNLIGTILIIAALALSALPFVRPSLFRRQDIVLIIVFLIAGFILFFNDRWYGKELIQFNLILLTISAIFYTVESIRLRSKNPQQ
ncbi:MAG: Ycf66 family protein [Pelatocladus maniniholoensis HA4357-MV3]|jgi:energy-coupling factor transporter transmembrane protein EcfT|uniref:Ycf66 family protein n=1 Tax=Pelatocladus maniniholoensis HA4357-MV3 TaxID=1117104 RepID=A0A9E3H4Z6_9NOST|nr:Ycf66 family protein [Pelatocladus maniniholoensis HA4357-MV3]BAZ67133.1 Ycf66 family protein [Fischerella sp. NIES-4106]